MAFSIDQVSWADWVNYGIDLMPLILDILKKPLDDAATGLASEKISENFKLFHNHNYLLCACRIVSIDETRLSSELTNTREYEHSE